MSDVRLRGNTFLLLLLRSGSPILDDQTSMDRNKGGVTRANMLGDLIHIVNPSQNFKRYETLVSYFSQYLSGTHPFSRDYYPFNKPAFTTVFKERMESSYDDVLSQMDTFCRTYLDFENDSSMRLLTAGLIVAINNDKSIHPDAEFFTGYDSVKRKNLRLTKEFILQPFLLSVWFYIVMNKPNASEGSETYEEWTEAVGENSVRNIKTRVGSSIMNTLTVSTIIAGNHPAAGAPQVKTQDTDDSSKQVLIEPIHERIENDAAEQHIEESMSEQEKADETEKIDAEVVDDAKEIIIEDGKVVYKFNMQNNGSGTQIGINNAPLTINL